MNGWFELAPKDRRLACEKAAGGLGISAVSVEKDFWVCWTLRELLTLPGWGEQLTFKGGTSLSKAWKLIDRFSEDIDLVIEREHLGFGGTTLSRNRVDKLKAVCSAKIDGELRPAAARRTFWEKAMLLHEEYHRPVEKPVKKRLSRHYYDLWCLIKKGSAAEAVKDAPLFDRIAKHRQAFFRQNWLDYKTLKKGSLLLVPPSGRLAEWRQDYQAMRGDMFFSDPPEFAAVLEVVGQFEAEFNKA